jgi:hypothetical protein
MSRLSMGLHAQDNSGKQSGLNGSGDWRKEWLGVVDVGCW